MKIFQTFHIWWSSTEMSRFLSKLEKNLYFFVIVIAIASAVIFESMLFVLHLQLCFSICYVGLVLMVGVVVERFHVIFVVGGDCFAVVHDGCCCCWCKCYSVAGGDHFYVKCDHLLFNMYNCD